MLNRISTALFIGLITAPQGSTQQNIQITDLVARNTLKKPSIDFCPDRDFRSLFDNVSLLDDPKRCESTPSQEQSLEKFKEKIPFFFRSDEFPVKEMAESLCEMAPKDLSLDELIELIFWGSPHLNVALDVVDYLVDNYYPFNLSAYNQIRRAIIEDKYKSFGASKDELLTNSWLDQAFSDLGPDLDEKQIESCYDLAYRIQHPYIYRTSPKLILPNEYSLNFLWVNLNPQDQLKDQAENIFNDGLDASENLDCVERNSFICRIEKWKFNPETQINIWYDGSLVTPKALKKTSERISHIAQLRDIRKLPNIPNEIRYSLHHGTPVYYRVDILKALIADYMITSPKEPATYCVISDIDVEAMNSKQLFDQRTLDYLSSNGYVFNGNTGIFINFFENNFYIFNREKKDLQKIHYKSIIDRTVHDIIILRDRPHHAVTLTSNYVYNLYLNFIRHVPERLYNPNKNILPRKHVQTPMSRFQSFAAYRSICNHEQEETVAFVGEENIPYTRNGRNCHQPEEAMNPLIAQKEDPSDMKKGFFRKFLDLFS